jgi:hypothetical protein
MKEVVLDGVAYTKAAVVAKEFGYTTDYVGQLCRTKKVDARLVGRSWYVNRDSLQTHRQQRYTATHHSRHTTAEQSTPGAHAQSTDMSKKQYLRRVPPPNARRRTFTAVPSAADGTVKHVSVHYEPDEHSLLPRMTASPKVTLLKVDMADAKPLKIHSGSTNVTLLEPNELPDVALSGTIKVAEIPDAAYTNDPALIAKRKTAHTDISPKRDTSKNKLKIEVVETLDSEKNKPESTSTRRTGHTTTHSTPAVSTIDAGNQAVRPVEPAATALHQQQPVTDSSFTEHHELNVSNLNAAAPQPVSIDVRVVAVALVVSVLCGSAILSLEQVGFVTGGTSNFDLEFVWRRVTNLALILFTG